MNDGKKYIGDKSGTMPDLSIAQVIMAIFATICVVGVVVFVGISPLLIKMAHKKARSSESWVAIEETRKQHLESMDKLRELTKKLDRINNE